MVKRKLQSEKGASITFALLIFLVCAVASSIVIVAATTTSGRLSGLASSDQRYYAVTSAARLLCDEFGGKRLRVERDSEEGFTITYQEPTTLSEGKHPVLEDASKLLAQIYEDSDDSTNNPISKTLKLTASGNESLSCDITEKLENGLLRFEISSQGGESKGGTYKLIVTFASNYKYVATEDESFAADVSWKLQNIQKYNNAAKKNMQSATP